MRRRNMANKKVVKKRRLMGEVVSDKMNKTRVVLVTRLKKHPLYQKFYKVSSRFKAHDEKNEFKVGDVVIIEETRPLSKEKRWRIVGLVKRKEAKNGKEVSLEAELESSLGGEEKSADISQLLNE